MLRLQGVSNTSVKLGSFDSIRDNDRVRQVYCLCGGLARAPLTVSLLVSAPMPFSPLLPGLVLLFPSAYYHSTKTSIERNWFASVARFRFTDQSIRKEPLTASR